MFRAVAFCILLMKPTVQCWAQTQPKQSGVPTKMSMLVGAPKAIDVCKINNTPATDAQLMAARQGWIKIVLARRLDLGDPDQSTRYKKGTDPLKTDDSKDLDGDPIASASGSPEHDGDHNPFNIYLSKSGFTSSKLDAPTFIPVQLIIKRRANYKFGQLSDIGTTLPSGIFIPAFGITGSQSNTTTLVCRASDGLQPPSTIHPEAARQFAKFYIDTSKLVAGDWQASYNIILQPIDSNETPILIDPKIWNDG